MSSSALQVYEAEFIQDLACDVFYNDDTTATTLALALASLTGFRNLGHCPSAGVSVAQESSDHIRVNKGRRIKDRKGITSSEIKFQFNLETLDAYGTANMLLGTVSATDRTQAALTSQAVTAFAFTTAVCSGGASVCYPITYNEEQLYALTAVALVSAAITGVTFANATDLFTKTAHGLKSGQPIKFGGTPPTGMTTSTVYYLVNVTADTFQVALTPGGSAIVAADDGTSITVICQWIDDTSCLIDYDTGNVQFLYPAVTTVTPTVSCLAVSQYSNATKLFKGVTPLDSVSKSGWFHVVGYHQGVIVADYYFKGQLTTSGGSGWDGSKAANYGVEITVGDVPGKFWIRGNNA